VDIRHLPYLGHKITPISHSKRGARRVRQNKSSGNRGTSHLRGRQALVVCLTNSSGAVGFSTIKLDPLSLSDRPAAVAAAFQRYRIVRMVLRFRSSLPSNVAGHVYTGVIDDASDTTAITTGDQVLNLRTSQSSDVWKDHTLIFTPVDPSKWYYINAESSTSDQRFITQATFAIGSSQITIYGQTTGSPEIVPLPVSVPVAEVDVDYHYVFDGATIVTN
jgi:hypothetical protein